MIRELAENANTYTPLAADEERIVESSYVISLGAGSDPHFTVVQRLRLGSDEVEEAVDEIRALIAARSRTACTWEAGSSATPDDLVARLLALGCEPDREPLAIGMVLTEPPGEDTADVTARRVRTLAEYEEAIRIVHEAFDMPQASTEEALARAATDFEREGDAWATYLAFVDGRPVARATAVFTEHGALLFGGATLAEAQRSRRVSRSRSSPLGGRGRARNACPRNARRLDVATNSRVARLPRGLAHRHPARPLRQPLAPFSAAARR